MSNRRVPPNIFAIPFGLAGLSEAWQQAQETLHTPAAVPDAIAIGAALAWLALIAAYASQGAGQALADLRDRALSRALAGYAILMILVQARMLPRFARLKFAAGFWAFTFSWAATCAYALAWIAVSKPPGAVAYAAVIIAVITAFIGYIAARTVLLALRGQLLPRPQVISAPNENAATAVISPSR